jgi:glutamate synthase domain-containing protein 2
VRQRRHAVLRNYPVIGHLRYLLEFIRPEIRQYFIESDTEAVPFSRQQRSLVYQRAKGDSDKRPFGTQLDVHATGYEWINHSMAPTQLPTHDFRVTIGDGGAARSPTSQRLQHLGDELRRAVAPTPSWRSTAAPSGRLRARHRRRLDQPAPPRARRRPDLGDRLGLLRLPQRRRQLQRGQVHARTPATRRSR